MTLFNRLELLVGMDIIYMDSPTMCILTSLFLQIPYLRSYSVPDMDHLD